MFKKILVIDNFDSFTYNLVDYLLQCNVKCQVVKNDLSLSQIQELDFDALLISPGPGTPESSGFLFDILHFYINLKPILGICLGHQALGIIFGYSYFKSIPKHGKISEIEHFDDILFQGIPNFFYATRYHSWILNGNSEHSKVIAQTSEGLIMGIKHNNLPVWGLQFHPESFMTQYGLKMIQNWVKLV